MDYELLLSWKNPVTTGLLYSLLSLGFGCGMLMEKFTLTGVGLNGGILVLIGVVAGIQLGVIRKDWVEKMDWGRKAEDLLQMGYNGVNGLMQEIHSRVALPRAPYLALFLLLIADLSLYINTCGLLFLFTQYLFLPQAIRTFLGLNPDAIVKFYVEFGKETASTYLNLLPRARSTKKSQ